LSIRERFANGYENFLIECTDSMEKVNVHYFIGLSNGVKLKIEEIIIVSKDLKLRNFRAMPKFSEMNSYQ